MKLLNSDDYWVYSFQSSSSSSSFHRVNSFGKRRLNVAIASRLERSQYSCYFDFVLLLVGRTLENCVSVKRSVQSIECSVFLFCQLFLRSHCHHNQPKEKGLFIIQFDMMKIGYIIRVCLLPIYPYPFSFSFSLHRCTVEQKCMLQSINDIDYHRQHTGMQSDAIRIVPCMQPESLHARNNSNIQNKIGKLETENGAGISRNFFVFGMYNI